MKACPTIPAAPARRYRVEGGCQDGRCPSRTLIRQMPAISPIGRMAARTSPAYADGMRYEPDASRTRRGPEEIALDSWLEDGGPYVTLAAVGARRRRAPTAEYSRASSAGSYRASIRARRARQSASRASAAAG